MYAKWRIFVCQVATSESELLRIPLPRTPVNKGKEKGSGFVAPDPFSQLKPLCIGPSKLYYFGPGHFGWLFLLPHGFALPLK